VVSAAHAGVYYVDCAAGDDAADGLSTGKAWRSVRAVSAREFRAGDRILLRRGTECGGTLWPKGSGAAGAPILLDAWGEGRLPVIRAEAGAKAAFELFNQEYWTVQHLELIGGEPHGLYVSGSQGVLHGIHICNVVVHGVTGEPKNKEGGLVVIAPGSAGQRFDDVIVEGVTAYGTAQWAGILVGSVALGFLPVEARSTNVAIRNSMVHDVAGDGIVLFQVNHGRIEDSVAWYTGMQQTQSIGTPNAVWTWMCGDCAVRRSEAFLTDSPGVDGGAFDIDYGDEDNVVEDSYGHDTQGYCVAVFGAGGTTSNSVVRRNVCAGNGRSPRLAASQGAVYLTTWNQGRLKGVRIAENWIRWEPPIAAAAVVNTAEFDGEGEFEKNTIETAERPAIRSNAALKLTGNAIGPRAPRVAESAGGTRLPAFTLRDAAGRPVSVGARGGGWRLWSFVPASGEQVALVASVYRQFHAAQLEVILIVPRGEPERERNQRWDWNLGGMTVLFDDGSARAALGVRAVTALMLVNAAGEILWRHDGVTAPGELGLALRSRLGEPDHGRLISEAGRP